MSAAVTEGNGQVDATEAPRSLVARVAIAMANAGDVVKDRENDEHHYKFASVESMLKAVRGPLLEQGVILVVQPRGFEDVEVTARSGSKGTRIVATIDFTFTDGEDSFSIEGWRGEAIDYSDKAYGKAYTNAIKTFIRAQWLLPADDDTDSDRQSPERGAAAGGVPSWAGPLNKERNEQLLGHLEVIVGRDVGRELLLMTKDRAEHVPAILLPFAKALVDAYLESDVKEVLDRRKEAAEALAAAAREEQDSAAEAPDVPREPSAGDQAESDVPADTDGLPVAGGDTASLEPEGDGLFGADGDDGAPA